ncbi:YD repeat-containing protein [Pontibacter ummariensis]|uniref:YD repeat-containing protein n=1 Tax=Pontibacter ummariensis TaxID=1610492 RepID=A0A239HBS7_9BACT|nr:YD repeat-containing protein [Pontibacter ummariensis]SNS78886.1 YD repeat-containing protein [Pontibacter ummariensis]
MTTKYAYDDRGLLLSNTRSGSVSKEAYTTRYLVHN